MRAGTTTRLLAAGMTLAAASTAIAQDSNGADRRMRTFANPVDLPYRYQPGVEAYREGADPTVVRFQGKYWLFVSHSKGYWSSTDLIHWTFVKPTGLDVDRYAPTVMAMNGRLYMAVSEGGTKIWSTDDPLSGRWTETADISPGYYDPCLFLDDDGKVYLYEGLSGADGLRAYELDAETFQPISRRDIAVSRDPANRGWEVVGDRNELTFMPSYIEGAWMTKHAGRYYLQYSAPGTEFKTYADGVLVADKPLGPFRYDPASPFAVKPTGFIAGAGHGSTFDDPAGNWWHVGTMTISQRYKFERRIGLFPTYFTSSGKLIADTYLGDYPRYVDGNRELTGWMLLSLRKPVAASSSLGGHGAASAVDEDVRSWWSAKSGRPGEWFQVDLGAAKRIEALQINFADQDSKADGISSDVFRYTVELSDDGKAWRTAIDHSRDGRDAPHDYQVLPNAQSARFVRVRSVHMPDQGKFSLYDLRVFGNGGGAPPATVPLLTAVRDAADPRRALISWEPARGAEFYVVRYGTSPDAMNQSYQVYEGQRAVSVASLNAGTPYFVAVDAINENGMTAWAGEPVAISKTGRTR